MSVWEGFEEVVAIADAGSFAGGAKLLGMSASQMSRVVARLEERINAQLFIRTTRRLSLTDTGLAFVAQCRTLLQERDDLLSQINGSGVPQGGMRMTCSVALGERFVAPLVARFIALNPKLSVVLDLTNRLIDPVGEGYDLGLRTGQVTDSRLLTRKIATRRIEVCASRSYLKRAGTPSRIEDLEQHECLIGTSATWRFQEHGVERSFTPSGRFRCNSGEPIVGAAIAGVGICQLPRFYVQRAIDEMKLVPILEDYRPDPESIWAVYPQRRHLQPKVRNMVDLLEQALQPAIDAGEALKFPEVDGGE